MTAEKPEKAKKGNDDGLASSAGEDIVERLLQERFNQLSLPFICPFCGKTECKSLWHLIKLSTISRSYLRPKHFFLLYGVFFIAIMLILGIYIILKELLIK